MKTFKPIQSFRSNINASIVVYIFTLFFMVLIFLIDFINKDKNIEILVAECFFGCVYFVGGAIFYYVVPFADFAVDNEKIIQNKFGIKRIAEWSEIKKTEKKAMGMPFIYWGATNYIVKTQKSRFVFSDKLENAEELWKIINENFEKVQKNKS